MDGVWLERFDAPGDGAWAGDRQADFGVGGAGDAAEVSRSQKFDRVAAAAQFLSHGGEGADNAVYLGMPSVGDD